jgi:cytochrome c oxidase subunit IV
MSTGTADERTHTGHDDAVAGLGHDVHPDSFYVKIAAFLAILTALEVSTYFFDFGPLFLPTLLTLMAIKFFSVAWFFMHLRDDSKLFSRLFFAGLFLAIGVYVVALSTFQFFLRQ